MDNVLRTADVEILVCVHLHQYFKFCFLFFVACTSGNAERTVDLSRENVTDYFDNYTYNDLYQLLRNRGPHSIKSRSYSVNTEYEYLDVIKINIQRLPCS